MVIAVACLGLCVLLFLGHCGVTTYALASSNIEVQFLVTDARTGGPIPEATIAIRLNADGNPLERATVKLVTDQQGKASYFRSHVKSEDIIRPFRMTRRTFDLTWAVYSVSAKGFAATMEQPLHG